MKMNKKNLIVFDMDGVLIDVSKSYRDTVRQTAGLFFKIAPSSEKLPDPLFDLADLAAVKQSGGLNNDWDLTCLIINLLFNLIEKPPVYDSPNPWLRYQKTISRCQVGALGEFLKSTPQPLSALFRKTRNAFIYGLYSGDVGSGNIIKQIFQEIYLGRDLFEATYHLAPQFYHEQGFIHREQLLVDKAILAELSRKHILAIATGRPRAEADYPLESFWYQKIFYKRHGAGGLPRGRSTHFEGGSKKGFAQQTRSVYARCHCCKAKTNGGNMFLCRRHAGRHDCRKKIGGRL